MSFLTETLTDTCILFFFIDVLSFYFSGSDKQSSSSFNYKRHSIFPLRSLRWTRSLFTARVGSTCRSCDQQKTTAFRRFG